MNLTDFPISDTNTQNLVNGLLLLLKTYPDSKVEIFNERNVAIEVGSSFRLITEEVSDLISWGWRHDHSSYMSLNDTVIHWWYFEVDNKEEE